jgi:hypothetical protein
MTYRKKYIKLKRLIREWTRAEIMARFGQFDNLEFVDYALIQRDKVDEIRVLLYDTDDLCQLGLAWGMLRDKKEKQRKVISNNKRKGATDD